jgi:hypothetical protein
MRNVGAALLGAVVALGVCAAVLFAGVLGGSNDKTPSTPTATTVAQQPSSGTSLAALYS